jgi:hypothetical protein
MVRTPGMFHVFLGWKTWETCGGFHGIFMGFNDLNETSWRLPWDFFMMFDLLENWEISPHF